MIERTWSGTHTFEAARIAYPTSIDEAAQIVREEASAGRRVRGLGTRHSFNDVADSPGTLVSMLDAVAEPYLVDDGAAVHVSAGMRYGQLALWLQEHGKALGNMGSLPHISVAGAMSTGTHGSGDTNGVLASSVRQIEWIDADGAERTTTRGEPGFDGMVVALGAFGIITGVVVEVETTYLVQQDVYRGVTWETLFEQFDKMTASAHSVSIFTMWDEPTLEQVWVKRRITDVAADADSWFGGEVQRGLATLVDSSDNLTAHGVTGPWLEHLPHFRVDSTPSNGDEIQTEYFVPREHAVAAIAAVRELGSDIAPLLLVSELRTVAADDLWLSPAYERAIVGIHFTWRNDLAAVTAVLPAIESALAPFHPRPHWGKVNGMSPDAVGREFPRLAEARKQFERLDPNGVFSNSYLERLGIRAPR